ncbi:MAG: phosphoribosyl-AMP cyclohydrolase [Candidatus Lokiarchaeota archaeon]|nr:phosphoribosyl-AMP cyclohydrolase [Candidatus Lokiarchaeota archaeon]
MKKFSKQEISVLIDLLDFSKINGNLIPVIAQDYESNEVLMLAFANKIAIEKSLETGHAYYYSRSRQKVWKKGESSGHIQEIKDFITDCDNDSVLIKVKQTQGACHKGYYSCFFKILEEGNFKVNRPRIFDPNEVYEK